MRAYRKTQKVYLESKIKGKEKLEEYGGPCAIRTRDQLVKSQLLYQLS